jgi:hypothetical protein
MFQASMGPFGGVGSCCPQAPRVLCRRTRMCRPASTGTADTARLTPADARAVPEQGKGKSVIARWRLEEAPSKEARRRTGTEYEVWYTWDELARNSKALHPRVDVLYTSGAYARTVPVPYPGRSALTSSDLG